MNLRDHQGRPTLDDYDGSRTYAGDREDRPRRKWPTKGGSAIPRRTVLGGGCCWCGEPGNHDWPGRADGAPHPR